MFRQEKQGSPFLSSNPSKGKKSRRKIFVAVAALALIVVVAGSLFAMQGEGATMTLNLNYEVGEQMVYAYNSLVTNQRVNATLSLPGQETYQSSNSTITMDIIGIEGQDYKVNETIHFDSTVFHDVPPFTVNISKTSYYNNFIAPGGPLIFYNATNPTILAYLAQPNVKAGDTWTIPINTGNTSFGLTGEATLKFVGIEDITVSAGTYTVMRIEISSGTLSLHSDDTSPIKVPDGMAMQLNGTSYVEQSTCRLIKADLTQATATNSPEIGSNTVVYTEKTLVEHTKP